MEGWIEPIPGDTWADVGKLACAEWLWIDTAGDGVHVATTLPDEPAQVTHLWGWGEALAVRVRIDPDLPHSSGETGAAGAVLHLDKVPADRAAVEVHERLHPVWPAKPGRANMRPTAELTDPQGNPLVLRALHAAVSRTTVGGDEEQHTVTFLRR